MWVEKLKIPASNYHHLPRSLPVKAVISAGRYSLSPFPILFIRIATSYSPLTFAAHTVSLNALKKNKELYSLKFAFYLVIFSVKF